MTTRPLHTDVRIIVLSGAALLLAAWNLSGLLREPAAAQPVVEAASEPTLQAELVGAEGSSAAVDPAVHIVRSLPGSVQDAQRTMQAALASHVLVADVPPAPADGLYVMLLDRVFAPDRFVREPAIGAASGQEMAVADLAMDGRGEARGAPPATPSLASPVADQADARRRPGTEKSYYEGYLALATQDAQELERQAAVVLRQDSENCQKVAMLRALYDTDRSRALAYFAQAITGLPDRPVAEGVSVPAFAVGFLSKQLTDPAVKGMVERMAWSGYLNVSPELQRQASAALLAVASPADLQRYAAYPATATVAGGEEAR